MRGGWRRRGTRWSPSSRRSASKAGTSATCSTVTAWRRASKSVSGARRTLEESALAEKQIGQSGQSHSEATRKLSGSHERGRRSLLVLYYSSIVPLFFL